MAEHLSGSVPESALVDLHNELVRELNVDKDRLTRAKGERPLEVLQADPLINYAQGRVIGFEHAVQALHAFIVTRNAETQGLLEVPEQG